MPEVRERDVCDALLRYKGSGKINIGEAEIGVSLIPVDNHNADSPDCLLMIELSLKLFGQDLKLKIPIPVEAEKVGLNGAIEDLEKLIERERFPIEMPMLVVAESGFDSSERKGVFPTRFVINQIPVRLLKEKSKAQDYE